jgi:hypothetical protein
MSDLAALTGMSPDELGSLSLRDAARLTDTVNETLVGMALSNQQVAQAVRQRLAPTVRAVRAARSTSGGGGASGSSGSEDTPWTVGPPA